MYIKYHYIKKEGHENRVGEHLRPQSAFQNGYNQEKSPSSSCRRS